jgi:hypothetical protein
MVRLNEQDKQRIYVIRKTAEDIKLGSWADCETIYNLLSEESRTQDTLSKAYKQLDKAEMDRATCTPEWNATRVQVRQWLRDVRLSQNCKDMTDCLGRSSCGSRTGRRSEALDWEMNTQLVLTACPCKLDQTMGALYRGRCHTGSRTLVQQ